MEWEGMIFFLARVRRNKWSERKIKSFISRSGRE